MARKPCNCGKRNDALVIGSQVWVKGQKGRRMLLGILPKDVKGTVVGISGTHYTVRLVGPPETVIHTTRNQLTPI